VDAPGLGDDRRGAAMSLEAPGPIVEVIWVDSTGDGQWHQPEDAEALLSKMDCLSVGYLLHDTPEGIVVSQGTGAMGMRLGSMAIPRAAVISVRHLDKKAKP
jgi:hypothetical protein